MPKIHRSDLTPPQEMPAAPHAALYDQDNDADFVPPAPAAPKKKRENWLYTLAMVVFGAMFLISAGLLIKRYFDDRRTENEFADLQSLIDTSAAPESTAAGETVNPNGAKFAALREKNADFIGWISIDGTNLDFPVMYAPTNKDFYLRHDFDKNYSVYGVPYLDENTTLGANGESDNLIIYGHNMKTGTIFGCLTEYKKAAYYQEHPYIEFDTVYGDAKYEVFAAFAIDVVNDTSFVYNQYIDMDEDTYNAYVEEVLARSDVDSGIRPAYGEQLLTLSTCEYSSENGRYVVVARRVAS
ncbi:sortase domain-containing protein [Gemmiger sp.]